MGRRLLLLPVLAVLALPVTARVISYAPYTTEQAQHGHHLRTSRYFPLIEGRWTQKLVLYDSKGIEEPRVLVDSSAHELLWVAWHEGRTRETSKVLLGTVSNQRSTYFSRDGGATWTHLHPFDNEFLGVEESKRDEGGPWTGGMRAEVRIGNDEWPFVVSYGLRLWAISARGEAKRIGYGFNVGQNRAGTRYLMNYGGLRVIGVDGQERLVTADREVGASVGWISDDGTVYFTDHRRLMVERNGEITVLHESRYDDPVRYTDEFIVIPTHDFGGAWMIERLHGQPTILSRYTPAEGLREMWSDDAAPDVEALIAGNSGDTLLIQVHRPRVMPGARFIDPALAVWRVGEPAPRAYDELYLNETWYKGFVHVDVDRIAAGEPFVFTSGVDNRPNEGPVSGGGSDVVQEWGVVRASLKQRLILPGVMRLSSALASHWRTDITIYNPLDAAQDVEVRYVPLDVAANAANTRTARLSLRPFEIRSVPDVLHALFALANGGGALHFTPEGTVNVTGRTYTPSGAGTVGYGLHAVDALNAASSRFQLTFAGAFPGENFRTNLLLTDTSGNGSAVSMHAYGGSGEIGASPRTLLAPSNGILQLNDLGSRMGLFRDDEGGLSVRPTRGTSIAAVVATDTRSNDPTYFPPDAVAMTGRHIPIIGHAAGAHGAEFRTDLHLLNVTGDTQRLFLTARHWNSRDVAQRVVTLLPHEARVVPDALMTLFGMTGLARLAYSTSGGDVRVTSRSYTRDANGATFGTAVPPLNGFQIITAGETLQILGAGGSTAHRTNLGLIELTPSPAGAPVRVRVSIIGSERSFTDSFVVEVPRSGGLQFGHLLTSRGIDASVPVLLAIEPLDAGQISAFATLTDNRTNDTTYLGADLAEKPSP